jgi:hypothetical protein
MGARSGSLAVLLLSFAMLGRAAPLGAQSSASAAWQATPASVLKAALRSLATAQERYRATKGRYAAGVDQLGIRLDPGVRVDVLGADAAGWQGRAVHQAMPGRSCVMFVGSLGAAETPRTDGDHQMAGEEGIPLCDWMR